MKLNNNIYDVLKWITLIALPATGTAYLSLSQVLTLPYPAEVTGSILVLTTFLGTLLGISTSAHNKKVEANPVDGLLKVDTTDPTKDVYAIELEDDLERLAVKDKITLRVTHYGEE